MKCPTCGNNKVKQKEESWVGKTMDGNVSITFMCGGRFLFDEDGKVVKVISKCRTK